MYCDVQAKLRNAGLKVFLIPVNSRDTYFKNFEIMVMMIFVMQWIGLD